jgi:hypothetical protein
MTDPLNPHSDDLREFFYSAPPAKQALETLELRHPAFAAPARVVNDPSDLTATLETDAPFGGGTSVTFLKCNFRFVQPESADGLPSCNLEILNVGSLLMPYLEEASASPAVLDLSFRLYYSDDLTQPGYVLHGMTLKKVSAGLLRVTGTAGFEDFLSKPVPRRIYTTKEFPGLAR